MKDSDFVAGIEAASGLHSRFVAGRLAQKQLIDTTNVFLANEALINALAIELFDEYVN